MRKIGKKFINFYDNYSKNPINNNFILVDNVKFN